jgi:hypothetical protein
VALEAIDAVVLALRAAASADEAAGAGAPIVPGGLSAERADAVLAMPPRRLTQLEAGELSAEAAERAARRCGACCPRGPADARVPAARDGTLTRPAARPSRLPPPRVIPRK